MVPAKQLDAAMQTMLFEDPGRLGAILKEALENHMIIATGFNADELKKAGVLAYGKDSQGRIVELEPEHAYTLVGSEC
jgi:hypothetical protein